MEFFLYFFVMFTGKPWVIYDNAIVAEDNACEYAPEYDTWISHTGNGLCYNTGVDPAEVFSIQMDNYGTWICNIELDLLCGPTGVN